jgi:hypothetical protein
MSGTTDDTSAAPKRFDTLADPWAPRSEKWLGRGPSAFAGQENRPVLLGACPRSGTTLLRGMVDNHPDLAMPGESNFIFHLWRVRQRFGDLSDPANRRRVAKWIVDSEGRGAKRVMAGTSREEALERLTNRGPTLGSIFAACFEMYADRHGKPRWGDKRPGYAGFIETMFRLFPDAQFINLVRDPRGAIASQMKLGWDKEPEAALASSAATWETSIRRVDDHARKLRPDQLIDVRFEDLVREPHREITRICEWASLRHDDAIVDAMVHETRKGSFREGWHDKLNEPIGTEPVDNWRPKLAPDQLAFVQQVTGPYFERFGYLPVDVAGATPRQADLDRFKAETDRRWKKWRTRAREERRRRFTYRQPVAAVPRP